MGQLTRTEIVTQGQAEAGQKGKDTRLLEALVLWEQSQYKAWPFGYLRQTRTALALPAGTASLRIGAGEGGITNMIQTVQNPIWVSNTAYSIRSMALITGMENMDPALDERVNNPATNRGLPTAFKFRHALSTVSPYRSCLLLIPSPLPDRDYTLSFDYIELPITLQTDGSGIPLYPNDSTMKKFVECMALKWGNGSADPEYQACRDELGSMVTMDRIRDGQGNGNNMSLLRDPSVFL